MTLQQIRALFVQLSGHFDLANEDGSDNGANALINQAQRWLDLQLVEPIAAGTRRYQKDVPEGTLKLTLSGCRAIHEVWIASDDGKTQLKKKKIRTLREMYPTSWSNLASGSPCYYAETVAKLSPQQNDLCAGNYEEQFTRDFEDLALPDADCDARGTRTIVWMPPTDRPITVSVWGDFFTAELADDCDSSWWSEVHPDTLVHAALYALEGRTRNTEGTRDWLALIQPVLHAIDLDVAHEDAYGDPGEMEMEG